MKHFSVEISIHQCYNSRHLSQNCLSVHIEPIALHVVDLVSAGAQVDFLPSKAMSAEELAALKTRLADMAARMRSVETIIDGQPERFSIFFKMNFKTNGGRMMDVAVRTHSPRERLMPAITLVLAEDVNPSCRRHS